MTEPPPDWLKKYRRGEGPWLMELGYTVVPNPSGQPDPRVRVLAPKLDQAIWFCEQRGWDPARHVLSRPEQLVGRSDLIVFIYEGSGEWAGSWLEWERELRLGAHKIVEWGTDRLDKILAVQR